jgi:hypothetical protein
MSGVIVSVSAGISVRGHLHFGAASGCDCGGESGDGRGGEDRPHIAGESGLPHLFHQGDGEEGVAAEFEEVVVAADAFHVQQVRPDPG